MNLTIRGGGLESGKRCRKVLFNELLKCWDKELTAHGIWLVGMLYFGKQISELLSEAYL